MLDSINLSQRKSFRKDASRCIIKAQIERIVATFISRTRHKSPSEESAFIKVMNAV